MDRGLDAWRSRYPCLDFSPLVTHQPVAAGRGLHETAEGFGVGIPSGGLELRLHNNGMVEGGCAHSGIYFSVGPSLILSLENARYSYAYAGVEFFLDEHSRMRIMSVKGRVDRDGSVFPVIGDGARFREFLVSAVEDWALGGPPRSVILAPERDRYFEEPYGVAADDIPLVQKRWKTAVARMARRCGYEPVETDGFTDFHKYI